MLHLLILLMFFISSQALSFCFSFGIYIFFAQKSRFSSSFFLYPFRFLLLCLRLFCALKKANLLGSLSLVGYKIQRLLRNYTCESDKNDGNQRVKTASEQNLMQPSQLHLQQRCADCYFLYQLRFAGLLKV